MRRLDYLLCHSNEDTEKTELGLEPGLEQGLEPGLGQGLEQGLEPGLETGLETGLEPGLEAGLEQGLEQGLEPGKIILNLSTPLRELFRWTADYFVFFLFVKK